MACIHLFLQMPYRQMEGFTRKLSLFIPGLRSADYTTLFHRIKELDLSLNVEPRILSHDVIVGVDSTGINVTNRGEMDAREVEGSERLDQSSRNDRDRDGSDPWS